MTLTSFIIGFQKKMAIVENLLKFMRFNFVANYWYYTAINHEFVFL